MKDKNPGYLKPKKLLKKKQQQRLYDWESERGHSNNKILRDNGDHTLLVHFFILDVATQSQKDHKLFSATHIKCSKKIGNKKIEGSSFLAIFFSRQPPPPPPQKGLQKPSLTLKLNSALIKA